MITNIILSLTRTLCLAFLLSHSLLELLLILPQNSFCFVVSQNVAHLQCPQDQKTALLKLKNGFSISREHDSARNHLDSWNPDIDCCSWEGIKCAVSTGHVVGLDLNGWGDSRLRGQIDSCLFGLGSLQRLNLSGNDFDNQLIPSGLGLLSNLTHLDLSHSYFAGQVPLRLSKLTNLIFLDLSTKPYKGYRLRLEKPNLATLAQNFSSLRLLFLDGVDLSSAKHNNFSGNGRGEQWAHAISMLSNLEALSLRDCGLRGPILPTFSQLHLLSHLDLSMNKLSMNVPEFLGRMSALQSLSLVDCGLYGELPQSLLSKSIGFQDYSNNMLTSTIPANTNFTSTWFFSLSNNGVTGEIPLSVCESNNLEVLDLAKNNFTGIIPKCLIEKINNPLQVLNLRKNSLQGSLPQAFKHGCNLQILDLQGNELEGNLPDSLTNCRELLVLDVGDNQLNDEFPFWLEQLSTLRVLILRSNNFYGPIVHSAIDHPSFTSLQIFDISSNNFTGCLSAQFFSRWKAMMKPFGPDLNYSIDVTMKGMELQFIKIYSSLAVIDLSDNRFQGEIPKSVGSLTMLASLNFSQNGFNGSIPISIMKLERLESLDISQNKLTEKIPWELTNLTFLGVLNVSNNLLIGKIPQGHQFETFSNDSFLGNRGLCGPPLSKKCRDLEEDVDRNTLKDGASYVGNPGLCGPPLSISCEDSKNTYNGMAFDWKVVSLGCGVGFGVGVGAFFWTIALWREGSKIYMQAIDRLFFYCMSNK